MFVYVLDCDLIRVSNCALRLGGLSVFLVYTLHWSVFGKVFVSAFTFLLIYIHLLLKYSGNIQNQLSSALERPITDVFSELKIFPSSTRLISSVLSVIQLYSSFSLHPDVHAHPNLIWILTWIPFVWTLMWIFLVHECATVYIVGVELCLSFVPSHVSNL